MRRVSTSQVVNLLHNLLIALGAILVARGLLSSDDLNALVGGATALAGLVINAISHQQALDMEPRAKEAAKE